MAETKCEGDAVKQHTPTVERRNAVRVPTSFGLMYSALDGTDVLMGDGIVVNLSRGGLGIRGNQPLKVGMSVALFLYLPDGDDPLFVLEASVARTNGRRFGVTFDQSNLREGKRLQAFLLAQSAE